jgi:hypothetical protein
MRMFYENLRCFRHVLTSIWKQQIELARILLDTFQKLLQ